MVTENFFNEGIGLVAATEPDDFRRRAVEHRHVSKIRILGDDGEAVGLGKFPDGSVIRFRQAQPANLIGCGK